MHRYRPMLPAQTTGHRVTPPEVGIAVGSAVSELLLRQFAECGLVGDAVNGGALGRGFSFHG
ncbi:MAG: hypothetical protein ACRDTF_15195 [Pseudonocardiaceae bacterium]